MATMMTILAIVAVGVAMAMMTIGMSALARAAVATTMTIAMTIGIVAAPVVAVPTGTMTRTAIEEAGRGRDRGTRMMTMTGIADGVVVRATTAMTLTKIEAEGEIVGLIVHAVIVTPTKMTVIVHHADGPAVMHVGTKTTMIAHVIRGGVAVMPPV